jgi:hypothetical protein
MLIYFNQNIFYLILLCSNLRTNVYFFVLLAIVLSCIYFQSTALYDSFGTLKLFMLISGTFTSVIYMTSIRIW